MNLKKFSTLTLAALTLSTVPVFADGISVMYDSKPITFDFAQPAIVNNRTLVPLRGVFDTMGYEISYDAETKTATISNDTAVIKASANQMSVTKNGKTTIMNSDVKPQLIDDYFMVPLRAVATATGAEVSWDADTKTVYISKADDETENIEGKMKVEEKEYLAQVLETTKTIKLFAAENKDPVLRNAFEITRLDSIGTGGDAAYYQPVTESLAKLKALEAPDSMIEVQVLVESYVNELTALINIAAEGSLNGEELAEKSLETSANLSLISQDYSEKLWNYFNVNEVYFEGVYGIEILDALKY